MRKGGEYNEEGPPLRDEEIEAMSDEELHRMQRALGPAPPHRLTRLWNGVKKHSSYIVMFGAFALFLHDWLTKPTAAPPPAPAPPPTLDQQERCRQDGIRFFDAGNADFDKTMGGGGDLPAVARRIQSSYTTHYNSSLGKCLVSIDAIDEDVHSHFYTHSMWVYDPNANWQYAGWNAMSNEWPSPAQKPMSCSIGGLPCETRQQFDAAVRPLMNE